MLPDILKAPLRLLRRRHGGQSESGDVNDLTTQGSSVFEAARERLLGDRQQLEAINARLLNDMAQLEAINARLLMDQEKIKGHNDLLVRMSDWYRARIARLHEERGLLDSEAGPDPRLVVGMIAEIDVERMVDLARQVPEGGLIVDIGSLMGQSASIWTNYSKAGAIVCVDPWKYEPWMEEYASRAGPITRENFLKNVPDPRIETIQGYSPGCARGWDRPVDLYWEDGDHNNPGCADGIRFWSEFVRPGGIACGHDCHWLDVMSEARALAGRWGAEVEVFGSVWSVRKPLS